MRAQDPVKYERYERAVYLYLCQRHQPGGEPAVVMVRYYSIRLSPTPNPDPDPDPDPGSGP